MKRKNILTVILIACISFTYCFAESNIFEKYGKMDQVMSFTLPKSMLQMVPDMPGNGVDLKGLKEKVQSMQIYTTQAESLRKQITDDFNNLSADGYTRLLQAKDEKANATIWAKENNDIISELVVFSDAGSVIAIVRMIGEFTEDDIRQVIQ